MVRDLDGCTFGHRGVLLDFGDPSMRRDLHPGLIGASAEEEVEHEGATWLRAHARGLSASFYWPASAGDAASSSVYVEARIRGLGARGVSVAIDGKALGSLSLTKGEARVSTARGTLTLAAGGHELELVFSGGPRAQGEPLAEIDWVHVGTGEPGEPYSAPTRADVLRDATAGGKSLRALALKAPGFVRCSGWVPANATLEAALSTIGGGDGEVEARLLRDRKPPTVLGTARVAPGGTGWAPWSVPITGVEGEGALGAIELTVTRSGKGTRVMLGEPRLVGVEPAPAEEGAASRRAAKSVVLIVLGNESPRSLAPWGGPHAVPELARVASSGVVFEAHRASSSIASSVLGSILTGLPARVLGMGDPDARLPAGVTTLQDACRQGGITTAMFTANPTTGAAFGFDRGWDTFQLLDPVEVAPGTQILDDAAAWVEAHKSDRFLLVVHARGGHPPWDVSPDELKQLPPDSYMGILEPRRAAETLTKAKKHPGRFKEDDRVRAWAFYDHALDAHDAAIGRLLAALHNAGIEDDTGVIVTGDVGPSEAGPVPFLDADTLEESLLATPLVIRWPHAGQVMRKRVGESSDAVDLARTVVGMLGLPAPQSLQGVDLALEAAGIALPEERPLAATRSDRLALHWGSFTLQAVRRHETRLCDLTLDPSCIADVRSTSPLALEALRRWLADSFSRSAPAPYPRETATIDPPVKASLQRWGRLGDEHDTADER
jgi:arylsulfatase A-like enzyme